jgi:hypothetical protein
MNKYAYSTIFMALSTIFSPKFIMGILHVLFISWSCRWYSVKQNIWGNSVVQRYNNSSILLYNPLIFWWMDSHPTATAGMYNRLRYQGLGFTCSRLHSQGTHSHPTATAGKQNAVPRDSVSPHCYSWCSGLQYEGTVCHHTVLQLVQQVAATLLQLV